MTRKKAKRFSVSLSGEDYSRLKALADNHSPPLSLQFVTEFAIKRLLDDMEDPQLELKLIFTPNRDRK